jgi:hypothetical protein
MKVAKAKTTKAKEPKKTGRKSKWDSHVKNRLDEVEQWSRQGLNDDQIAKNLGIGCTSLYDYKNKYPEFADAIKRGKEVAIEEVENALYKTALGFYYEEEELTKSGQVVVLKKYAKPNTTAQIFFLKNKKPEDWRDKREVQADVVTSVVFEGEDDIKE